MIIENDDVVFTNKYVDGTFRYTFKNEPNQIARIATEIASKLAIATAEPDGEDSSGRQKLKLLSPDKCAERACDIAENLYRIFKDRKWIFQIPAPEPEKKEDK